MVFYLNHKTVQLGLLEQNEDIKFKIKRAEFDITNTGKLTLGNDVLPTRTLKQNSLRTTSGSKTIRVFHPNHACTAHLIE